MYRIFVISLSVAILTACGGSSDSGEASTTTWQQGVFEDDSVFKNLCETPRTGTDPFNNNQPYPDRQGTLLDENNWLRSWSNDTYLWYDEIVDQNPANFNSTLAYFDVLKTDATTPSGNPKDNFHFSSDTAEYNASSQSGETAGYGAEWAVLQPTTPRRIVVAYVESNTPASTAQLDRGAEILEVNGVDVVNDNTQAGVDVINAGLFPSSSGQQNTFVVRDLNSQTTRTVVLTSEVITEDPVLQTSVIPTNTGNVGYLVLNTFGTRPAEEQLFDALTNFASENVTDLVVDLRYNGGGFVAISSQLAYMIAGAQTAGDTYNVSTFNNQHPTINPVTGATITPTPFYDQTLGFSLSGGTPLPTLNLDRVYVLSTSRTCSASELLVNGLRGIGVEVNLIGGTTCGKPYGFYPTDNCGTTYFTIQFKGANALGFGDYADGFSPANTSGVVGEAIPGCSVADDFDNVLGDTNEALLSAALQHRLDGSCPAPSGNAVATKRESDGISLFDSPIYKKRELLRSNQVYGLPSNPVTQ